MKRVWLVGLCAGLLAFSACGESLPVCAVLSFQGGDGIGVGEAGMLANRVAALMGATDRYILLPRYLVHRTLQTEKLNNPSTPDYALAAGKALDVPYVVTGSAGRENGSLQLSLVLTDVNSGMPVEKVTVVHDGAPDTFMRTAPVEAVKRLLGQDVTAPEMPIEPEWQDAPSAPSVPAQPATPVVAMAVADSEAAPEGMTEPAAPEEPPAEPGEQLAPVAQDTSAEMAPPPDMAPEEPRQAVVTAPVAIAPAAVATPKSEPAAVAPPPVQKPVPAPVVTQQPAPAKRKDPGVFCRVGQAFGAGALSVGSYVKQAVTESPVSENVSASWDSSAAMHEKIYWNLIRDRLEFGIRETEFDLDTTVRDGPTDEDRFLGTINQLDGETDSSFDKWFIRYYPIRWVGLEYTTDEVRARTITKDDGHSDGVFVADGNVLTVVGRLSLGDVLRVVDWASNDFVYPGRMAYAWGDRFRVYYGIGQADMSVDFEEDSWWYLGYADEASWLDDGSPTDRVGGRRRTIEATDGTGDVTTFGFNVFITRYLFLDFYTREMTLGTEATYDRSDATRDPLTEPIPLDNKVTGFGLGFVF